jgi:hypothetical protein
MTDQKPKRILKEIEDDLDRLQILYINQEDDREQMVIVRKFCHLLEEATELDGKLRLASGVTINNWVRET